MKKIILVFMVASLLIYSGCLDDHDPAPIHAKKYPNDVAVAWINLQQKLAQTTPGFIPGVTIRSFAYSGVSLYESIVPGMPGYKSITGALGGPTFTPPSNHNSLYWPASANAAMASIIKSLFASTSATNVAKIDSLETDFITKFQSEANPQILQASADFGKQVAAAIFEWSKTDGWHEGYIPKPSTYIPPVGPGLWIPTPPAFLPAANPTQGDHRTFVPGLTAATQPASFPLPAYSEVPGSDFYNMVNEIYTISQSLTPEEILIVKYWADVASKYTSGGHATHIATQLIVNENLKLDEAALIYAKHGIACRDALISCFKTKYTYNLIRPISYIRNVMGHTTWNTVIPTPAHPEFSSAHAVTGKASSVVLESFFGKKYSFTDRTHEALYGARTYVTLEDYANEGAWSRVLGGIHYSNTATVSLELGKKVGDLVNKLPFKNSGKD